VWGRDSTDSKNINLSPECVLDDVRAVLWISKRKLTCQGRWRGGVRSRGEKRDHRQVTSDSPTMKCEIGVI
jgi:hypothetical protein